MELIKIQGHKENNIYTSKLKVAAYVRVSTKTEMQQTSFESQCNYYKNKIEQNTNWTFVGIYSDYGISGKAINNRKDFLEMIKEARKGNIDYIVTKSISRFARNTLDTIKYVRELKEKNIGIYFEEENINTLTITGEMLLTVFASISQMERDSISSRIAFSYYIRQQNKDFVDIGRAYGYTYNKEKHTLDINPEQAPIVKKIFELYNDNIPVLDICDYLNSRNIKSRDGTKWVKGTISKMLKNEKYTGNCYTKYRIIENNNPAIISIETFKKTQKIKKMRQKIKQNDNEENIFFHKIKCNYCGGSFQYDRRKKYWKCTNEKQCRLSKIILDKDIEELFVYLTIQLFLYSFDNLKVDSREINKLKKETLLLENSKVKLIGDVLDKRLSFEYNKKIDCINAEILKIKEKLNKLNESRNDIYYKKSFIIDFKKNINTTLLNSLDKNLFNKTIKCIIVGDVLSNNRKDPLCIRFISKKNFYDDITIDQSFIKNNKFYKLLYLKTNKKRKIVNKDNKVIDRKYKVSFEILEEE